MAAMYQMIAAVFVALAVTSITGADEIRVAAATSVQHALKEITARFHEESGHGVKLVFGSSGNLARQILRGAPFDLFLSADETFISVLDEHGFTRGEAAGYAVGRLVLFVPGHSAVALDGDLRSLLPAAHSGQLDRLAIANPEHAPYGVISKQALENAGVWNGLQPYLVTGKNAAQATQFAITGSADAALIPASLATVKAVMDAGRIVAVSASLYDPLRQRMAVLSDAPRAARELYDFVLSEKAGMILQRHGFMPVAGL